jgi:hypothetical protein
MKQKPRKEPKRDGPPSDGQRFAASLQDPADPPCFKDFLETADRPCRARKALGRVRSEGQNGRVVVALSGQRTGD